MNEVACLLVRWNRGKTISWSEIKAAYDVKEVGACGHLGN